MLSLVNVLFRGRARKVSLDFPEGKFVGVVGANGAGKSTLARLLSGALLPDEGEVRLDGWRTGEPGELREIQRAVALIRSDPELQMVAPTVLEEVAFALRTMGLQRDEIRSRTEEALKQFELTPLSNAHPFLISAGEQHRLCLAAQVARKPRYLILDEFTGMLDSITRAQLLRWLDDWRARTGATVILITHRLEELRIADSVAVMSEGRLVAFDSPHEIYGQALKTPEWKIEVPFLLQFALESSSVKDRVKS